MKKLTLLSALVAMAAVSGAQAASSGTITFNGELTASTCDVSVDGKGPSSTVVLPPLSTSGFQKAGETGGTTKFLMTLTNCKGTLQTASAFFEAGPSVDMTSGRLKNTTGSATNVQLQLLDGSSTTQAPIDVGNSNQMTNTQYVDISSGNTTLPYAVRYYATNAATAGTVVSNVTYSIQYK
ncbi:MAG: type 1 fimbrial protein [Pantoea sp. Pent]|nr:type 1 fimbrial protein [Pantoea sp. Pent]